MSIEEGQQVQPGANIARVAQPDELQAELRVPETQARDVVDRPARRRRYAQRRRRRQSHSHRSGRRRRHGASRRRDDGQAAARRASRSVRRRHDRDRPARRRRLHGPAGVRPAELEDHACSSSSRKASTPFACPSSSARPRSTRSRSCRGLVPGDEVILSDTSAWDDNDRIRLN